MGDIDWSNEEQCLEAVKENGLSLRLVFRQTEKLCFEAVKEDGYALKYVKPEFKTKELCVLAIEQSRVTLRFVPKEYEDIYRMWRIMYG